MLETQTNDTSGVLTVGDLAVDKAAYRVRRQKREVHLGPKEYRLLVFMMESPGKIHSRGELLRAVWGDSPSVDERTVDLHIARLRKQIGLGKEDAIIRTVRGHGYVLGDF